MKKCCPGCNEERDAEQDFSWYNKTKGTRQRWCKFCLAQANKTHYQNNKQLYLKRATARNMRMHTENVQNLHGYLLEHPCVDCGQSDIRCLEFDHVRGIKSESIGTMLKHSEPWEAIETEIAKCEVRCANCHRIKTLERGKWWRSELVK